MIRRKEKKEEQMKQGICCICHKPKEKDRLDQRLCLACLKRMRSSYTSDKGKQKRGAYSWSPEYYARKKDCMERGVCFKCGKKKEKREMYRMYCEKCNHLGANSLKFRMNNIYLLKTSKTCKNCANRIENMCKVYGYDTRIFTKECTQFRRKRV